jgi:hypothetical protein
MPSSNVRYPLPLIRQRPWYPGQVGGVPGVDVETGLRTHPTGAVFYVDPNHVDNSDARDGTNPATPLSTIGQALSYCADYNGDTIVVAANDAWVYGEGVNYATAITENVTVTVHGVRIIGISPSGALGPVWTPSAAQQTLIAVDAMDVLIEGFCFMGGANGGDAILATWDGATQYGENLTVRHCFFDEDIDTAIALEYSWNNYIHDCVFQECDTYGIMSAVGGDSTAYNKIYNNWFVDIGTSAISLLGGADDNLIHANHFFDTVALAGGAAPNVFIDLTGGGENLVRDNYLSCLLPVPANGDYDNTCSDATSGAWINNHCLDGPTITNPT